MSGFDWQGFLLVSAATLTVAAAAMVVTAVVARLVGRYSVVDVTWGLALSAAGIVGLALGSGDLGRRALLAALVTVWGCRLSWHIYARSRGHGEDPRYESLLSDAPGSRFAYAVRKVFLVQGVAVWFVALPLQVAAASPGSLGYVAAAGTAVWLVGVVFEAVGDAQLRAFKADPVNRGRIMDRGLWSWTRHPNYFGDACVWWGLWLIAAEVWPGVLTFLSPVAMTYFLMYATGGKPLERTMSQRPGYRQYMTRTSFFVPRPPRNTPAP
jgi:steroid 5-alpha reductase family enzyme